MSQTLHKTGNMGAAPEAPGAGFSPEELAKRRQASRRLAWMLGATALAFYLAGFLMKR
jgi:hypothetical protein